MTSTAQTHRPVVYRDRIRIGGLTYGTLLATPAGPGEVLVRLIDHDPLLPFTAADKDRLLHTNQQIAAMACAITGRWVNWSWEYVGPVPQHLAHAVRPLLLRQYRAACRHAYRATITRLLDKYTDTRYPPTGEWCPTCRALPGDPCTLARPTGRHHRKRADRATDHQWSDFLAAPWEDCTAGLIYASPPRLPRWAAANTHTEEHQR